MLNRLKSIDKCVAQLEYLAMIALMVALTLILVAQVVWRYCFASPIFWAEDVAVQILTLLTCIGISYLIYSDDMIKVDFVLAMLSEKAAFVLKKGVYALGLVVMLVVCFYAIEWVIQPENRFVVSSTTGLPKQYNYFLMVGSFCLMAWHLLVKVCCDNQPNHSTEQLTEKQNHQEA